MTKRLTSLDDLASREREIEGYMKEIDSTVDWHRGIIVKKSERCLMDVRSWNRSR